MKKYYETNWKNEWHKWTNKKSFKGETMKFFLGLEGSDRVLKSFTDSGGVSSSLPSSFDFLSPEQIEEYGVVKYRISTNSNSEGVYDLRFGTQLGPYQLGSFCGGHGCLSGSSDDCNKRDTTSHMPIVVLSKDCKNPPQASSAEPSFSRRRRKKEKKPKDDCEYCCTEVNGTKCYGCGKNPDTRCNRCIDKCYESTKKPKTLPRMSEEWMSSQSFLTEWV